MANCIRFIKQFPRSTTFDGGPKNLQKYVILSQMIPVTVTNIMLVVYGMSVGYPTILIPRLSDFNNDEDIHLNDEQISWIGSINLLILPLGCVLSGLIAQSIGRKVTVQISSVLITICWISFWFCNSVWHIYAALALSGFTAGLCESPVLTYIAEISQPRLRGAFLSSATLSITLGIFIEFLLGSFFTWRSIALYSAVLPLVYFITSFFIPESPYWLLIKNKTQKGRNSLTYLRGWTTHDNVEEELQSIITNNTSKSDATFILSNYTKFQFVHPFLLICFLFVVYSFTGLYTIQVYAVKIFEALEVPINQYDATVLLGVVQFLGCLVCVLVISFTGKRVLTFISILIAAIGSIVVALYASLANINYLNSKNLIRESVVVNHKWIPSVFLLIAAFALNSGIRTLPWNLSVEVFDTETRAVATGTLGAVFYFISFGCNKVFLDLVTWITLPGVFLLYGIVGLVSLVILYLWLPETEGKTLEEIRLHFAKHTKLASDTCLE